MSCEIQSGGILQISVIHSTRKAWSMCAWLKFHRSPGYSVTKSTQGPNWFPLINYSLSQHNQLTQSTAHQSRQRTCKNILTAVCLYTVWTVYFSCSLIIIIVFSILHHTARSNTVRVLVPGRLIVPYRRTEKDTKTTSKWFPNKASLPFTQCVWLHYFLRRKCKIELHTAPLQRGMCHTARTD